MSYSTPVHAALWIARETLRSATPDTRNTEILKARANGLPTEMIARYVGLSHSQVRRIVRRDAYVQQNIELATPSAPIFSRMSRTLAL